MTRTKTSKCTCPYAPHDDRKCERCGHFLAHHYHRKPCREITGTGKPQAFWGCKECDEEEAKYGR